MITVSEKAYNKIIELMKKEEMNPTDHHLRIGVNSSGCAGLSYEMRFDNIINPEDQVFEQFDIKIITNKKSLLYLIGTELDYSDGLNGKGFEWKNPQASRVCGCGESFSI
jgi:iron-sulfur cluster assembly protein